MKTRRIFVLITCVMLAACSSAVQRAGSDAFMSEHITVTTRGSGPDIILIHGLAGHRDVWAPAAEALDDRYRLHLVQIHGFGGVPRTSPDSLISAAVVRELARYIGERELVRPALIGHSMGGMIAMMVATRHPDVAGRVMVVDMMPFMGAMFGQPNATVASLRPLADQLRTQLMTGDMLAQLVATMTRSDQHRRQLLLYANASDRRTVAQAMHEIVLTDLRPELSRITVPLTVLYVIPPNVPLSADQFAHAMRQLYSNAPDVKLVRIEDSNHYIQLDQPARFVAEVDSFMRAAR